MKILDRALYWIIYGLGLAILPILISFWIITAQHPDKSSFENLSEALGKGELLIACSALLGVNIGDLTREPGHARFRILRFSLIGASVIFSLFTLGAFVVANSGYFKLQNDFVTETSELMLLFTIGICCFTFSLD